MSADNTTETERKKSLARRIALPASIILNLFLVAVIGGHLWRHRAELTTTTPLARGLARAEAVLSPADAAAFRAVIRRNAPVYLEDQRRLTEARRALGRDITADRFDRDETQKALDDWRAAWNQFFDDFSKTLVDALAQVSPEGRRKLVAERQSARGRFLAP
jgi:uncharacterized membrane protein